MAGIDDALPLFDIKVVDFTTLLPGPLSALILLEAGAEVTKIEQPGGEELRRYPPLVDGHAALYTALNAGKKIVFADLKTEAGRRTALDLIDGADIVIEQFRPGVMARLGLDAGTLRKDRPALIYCSISGYGQSGPKSGDAGHDLNYIGETGLLDLAPGAPSVPPALIADIGGGSFPAIINILLALLKRERTGEGATIDIAMTDAMFTFAWWAFAAGNATGIWAGAGKGALAGGSPRYALYPSADGRLVAVAALEQKFWDTLCDVVDLPSQLRNDRLDPAATRAALGERLASKTAAKWLPLFEKADCCTTIVQSLKDAIAHPHFVDRGLFRAQVSLPDGTTQPALPVPVADPFRRRKGRQAPT